MSYTNGLDDPSAYFQALTYTGNGTTTNNVTNTGNSNLQPDWVWIKQRSATKDNIVTDSSRDGEVASGTNLVLATNTNEAEASSTGFGINYATNGINFDASWDKVNASGQTYVAWQWKANGGTTASNTDGSVTSTVQVNQDAGFSIVTWTTGVGSGNHSVGHGLGVKPAMFITKSRGGTSSWWTWHQGLAGDTSYVNLQATTAEQTFSDIWGDGITSSVFGYNYPATVNANQTYITYAFAEKQGYSKFGKYVGNGTSGIDGTFIYTGFKPAFVMTKRANSVDAWVIYDNKRDSHNVMNNYLLPNSSGAEGTFANWDFVSNGFKSRTGNSQGASGVTFIYMAFAENPFVTSTGIPTTAR